MASVHLAGISKVFGQNHVLQDIDLCIHDHEFMVLVGPSGCGKSTLLRLIAGLETVTEGKIYLGDRQIDPLPPKARDIAMVFQSYALYPHMTVFDNIAFGLRRQQSQGLVWLGKNHKEAIASQVLQVAKSLQIEMLLQRKPAQLSGGQKQRVALGRAIARNPQVFLMDEPLSNLDAKLRGETRSQIVQLQKQLQTTTIYVTHDQTEAMTMGHRIAILKAGRIQQVDTPLNLYRQPCNRFVAEFIGAPPMNFLPAVMDGEGNLQCPFFSQPLPLSNYQRQFLAVGIPLLLGIRPEHLQLTEDGDQAHCGGEIELLEVLGSEINVAIALQSSSNNLPNNPRQKLTVRCFDLSSDRLSLGERTHWCLNLTKIYLFDQATGITLYHPYLPQD